MVGVSSKAFSFELKSAISSLLKTDAGPPPRLLRNEFHASSLQGFLNFPKGLCGASYLSGSFEAPDSRDMYRRNSGEIGLAYVQQSSSSPYLGSINHAYQRLTHRKLYCYILTHNSYVVSQSCAGRSERKFLNINC